MQSHRGDEGRGRLLRSFCARSGCFVDWATVPNVVVRSEADHVFTVRLCNENINQNSRNWSECWSFEMKLEVKKKTKDWLKCFYIWDIFDTCPVFLHSGNVKFWTAGQLAVMGRS